MTAEKILKSKLDVTILIANNKDYTFNKVIEAMEEYTEQKQNDINELVEFIKDVYTRLGVIQKTNANKLIKTHTQND